MLKIASKYKYFQIFCFIKAITPRYRWLFSAVNVLLKALILGVFLWGLYRQFSDEQSWEDLWWAFRQQSSSSSWSWLCYTVALMPFNWLLEAARWHVLISRSQPIRFGESLIATLAGVSLALVTPNRTGDYVGRLLLVDPAHNRATVLATATANFCQWIVVLFMGWIGLLYYANAFLTATLNDFKFFNVFIMLGTMASLVFILYLNRILRWGQRVLPPRWGHYTEPLLRMTDSYDRSTLLWALLLAVCRYLVYCLQYYFMLRLMQIDIPLPAAMAGAASIYLVQSSIPLPPALGLLARGEIALLIWSVFETNELSILAASYGLFVINLCLPAFLGLLSIMRKDLVKSIGYEHANLPFGRSDRRAEHIDGRH